MSACVTIRRDEILCCPVMFPADLDTVADWLPDRKFSKKIIVTDNTVKQLHGRTLQKRLRQAGEDCLLLSFPPGEKHKTVRTAVRIQHALLAAGCDRDTLVLALGGGVVGDLAGFVAATCLRGLPYIQIPTTLLAMVDSSIGGKTGLNTPQGKNLTGVMHHPLRVVSDPRMLATLPSVQTANGFFEAVKIFLACESESFLYVSRCLSDFPCMKISFLHHVISRAIACKVAIVSRDETGEGERNILNFGHTIGHALEKVTAYHLLHGFAVGYGMLVESAMAVLLDVLDREAFFLIREVLLKLGIQPAFLQKQDAEKILSAAQHDKKNRQNRTGYLLPDRIGHMHTDSSGNVVHAVSPAVVRTALRLVTQKGIT